jgi:hypothetical protein
MVALCLLSQMTWKRQQSLNRSLRKLGNLLGTVVCMRMYVFSMDAYTSWSGAQGHGQQ